MEWYVDTVIKCIIAHATTNRMILFCLIAANGCGMVFLTPATGTYQDFAYEAVAISFNNSDWKR